MPLPTTRPRTAVTATDTDTDTDAPSVSARARRRGAAVRVKRCADVAGAVVGLVVLSPVAAGVALAVRARMGSPVLFRQTRPGLGARPFVLLKFRTMAPPRAAGRAAEEDFEARLTPLGRRLRTTSLDEIPQLVNVLRGDLSLVGPRPLLTEYLSLYDAEQARRHDVRPGVTGLAQVHGRSAMRMEDRFRHDVWYVDHWSLLLDVRIVARTVGYVLLRRGVAGDGAPSEPLWAGNAHAGPPAPATPSVPAPRPPPARTPVPSRPAHPRGQP